MSKYENLKYFAEVKARVQHRCSLCGGIIPQNSTYYAEKLNDKKLQIINSKKICNICHTAKTE